MSVTIRIRKYIAVQFVSPAGKTDNTLLRLHLSIFLYIYMVIGFERGNLVVGIIDTTIVLGKEFRCSFGRLD